MHRVQWCKRDALPAELTAPSADLRAFPELTAFVNRASNGTERKRAGAGEQQIPEIVPKSPKPRRPKDPAHDLR
jgi:hypothetical protein